MPNGWNAHPARTSALLLLERGRDARPVASALEDGGWTVTLAESAAAAMQLATANDYGLYVVAAAIEALPGRAHPAVELKRLAPAGRQVRLVLVAECVDAETEALAANAGADRIAVLPVLMAPSAAAAAGAPLATDGAPQLWVIDDSPAIRLLAGRAFERSGWRVTEFEDLHSARTRLRAGGKPLAVLLDIFLPDGNGLDQVSSFTATGAVVVMLSDLAGPEQVERAFLAGAVDIVAKPVDMRTLVARIEHAIRNTQVREGDYHPQALPAAVEDRGGQRWNDLRL